MEEELRPGYMLGEQGTCGLVHKALCGKMRELISQNGCPHAYWDLKLLK